jgi:hypothetical protein
MTRSKSYLLNQHPNRTVPGAGDIMGVTFAANAVSLGSLVNRGNGVKRIW